VYFPPPKILSPSRPVARLRSWTSPCRRLVLAGLMWWLPRGPRLVASAAAGSSFAVAGLLFHAATALMLAMGNLFYRDVESICSKIVISPFWMFATVRWVYPIGPSRRTALGAVLAPESDDAP